MGTPRTKSTNTRIPIELLERVEALRILAERDGREGVTRSTIHIEALAAGLDVLEAQREPDAELEAMRSIVAARGIDVAGASEDFVRGYFAAIASAAAAEPEPPTVEVDFGQTSPLTLTTHPATAPAEA